ncbi:MAG: hypothetical protein AAB250_06770, partial [Bdellovibrionota bacterium]
SQIGTSGNGKTEFGFALAETLFGSRSAAKKISGIQNWGDLNNHFRSDTGFVGSHQETDFERWFMSRKTLGGGVIILDELLSFDGMSREGIGHKIEAINKLYDMLDEGFIQFGNRKEDARGFIIEITGNAMEGLFDAIDDSQESERLVDRVLKKTSKADITSYFLRKYGMDAPKVARLGKIYLNGPLTGAATETVGIKDSRRAIDQAIKELSQLYDIKVTIEPSIIAEITKRVTTVKLGMRDVNAAIGVVLVQPVTGILTDVEGAENIKASLVNGKIVWHADGVEVVKTVTKLGTVEIATWRELSSATDPTKIKTPQLKDVEQAPKIVLTDAQVRLIMVHEVIGHWMVEYLLTGRNNAETISLIPDNESLGKVRGKDTSGSYEAESLTTWLREAAMLEAGARSTFIKGVFMSGGGTGGGPRDPNQRRADDLGRVDQLFDAMLSNQIFRGVTEFSDAAKKDAFKHFMRHISKGMADRLIRYGLNTKLFNPLMDEVMEQRFVNDTRLDELVKGVNRSKLMSPEAALFWSLSNSVIEAVRRSKSEGVSGRDLTRMAKLATEMLQKTSIEIWTKSRPDAKTPEPAWMREMRKKALTKVAEIVGTTTPQATAEATARERAARDASPEAIPPAPKGARTRMTCEGVF